ncbi:MAG: hypothetical protein RXP77_05160, partial [Nitrososphaeria archaeon]
LEWTPVGGRLESLRGATIARAVHYEDASEADVYFTRGGSCYDLHIVMNDLGEAAYLEFEVGEADPDDCSGPVQLL